MSEPTQGPYKARDVAGVIGVWSSDDTIEIAIMTGGPETANARLLAASWDLKEACEQVLDMLTDMDWPHRPEWSIDRLKDALAAAKGEPE